MKAAAERDLTVGGPELAGAGAPRRAGRRVPPVPLAGIVGGGKPRAPGRRPRSASSSSSERRFGNGVVHLHYAVAG